MLWKGESIYGGVTWEEDDSLLFCQSGKISRIPNGKDEAETLLELNEGEICGTPQLLPGGKWILFSVTTEARQNPWESAQVVIQSLTSGERRILSTLGVSPRYVPTGHLVFVRGNNLFAVPFNLRTMQVQGEASPILSGVRTTGATADYDFSDTGSLVYITGGSEDTSVNTRLIPEQKLTVLDRKGQSIASPLSNESREYGYFRLSPDGKQVAATVSESSGDKTASHIWIYDVASGYGRQLTFGEETSHQNPVWMADGKSIVYLSYGDSGVEILRKAIDGSGKNELLYQSKSSISNLEISPQGTLIFVTVTSYDASESLQQTPNVDVWTLPPGSDGSPSKFMTMQLSGSPPRFSPNGKWVAYVSEESGKPDVYVQPYPKNEAGKKRISVGGGMCPVWSSDGRALFYIAIDAFPVKTARSQSYGFSSPRMMEIPVQTESGFVNKPPVELFKMESMSFNFEVMPAGDKFVLIKRELSDLAKQQPYLSSEDGMQAYIVLNWFEELK